jgi:hypothetical protein
MGLRGIVNSAINRAESFFNRTEDKAKKAVKTAEKITNKQVNSFVKNVTSQINGNNPIVKNFVPPVAIPNPAKSLNFIDRAVNAGRNFVNNVRNVGNNLIQGGRNLLGRAAELGSRALDVGKRVFNEVKNRALDIGRSALNLVTEGVGGLVRSAVEGVGKIASGIGQALNPAPLGKLLSGDFSGAWNDFRNNVTSGAKQIGNGLVQGLIQGPFDTFIVGLQNTVSAIQTATGLEPAGRGLTEAETATLRSVYGDSIDLSQIRIKEGNIGLNNFLAPHTVGNTIYMPYSDTEKRDPAEIRELLVHETAHVWQYQNGGTDYIGESLWNQAKSSITGGDRGGAYGYDNDVRNRTPWQDLNPEQQGSIIEDAYSKGLFTNPNARFNLTDGTDVTDYVRNAIEQMRAGRGAA